MTRTFMDLDGALHYEYAPGSSPITELMQLAQEFSRYSQPYTDRITLDSSPSSSRNGFQRKRKPRRFKGDA